MLCSFAGVDCGINGRVSLTPGVMPNVFTITLPGGYDITQLPTEGTFVIGDGLRTITVPGCRAEEVELDRSTANAYWRVTVRDWRWRWRCDNSFIYGEYNRCDDRGEIVGTKMSLQELIDLLTADGRLYAPTAWDVSKVPTSVYPYANWDTVPAADALHELCQRYGLAIAIRPPDRFSGSAVTVSHAVIYPSGQTSDSISAEFVMSGQYIETRRPVPKHILAVGGRARYQAEVALSACAYDPADGLWKYLADEFSYKPSDGNWTLGLQTGEAVTDEAIRETLFRCYSFPDTITLRKYSGAAPEAGGIYTFTQMMQHLCETTNETEQVSYYESSRTTRDDKRFRRMYCKGAHCTNAVLDDPTQAKTGTDERVPVSFEIDRQRGLVRFGSPVFVLDGNGVPSGASLTLVCVFEWHRSYVESFSYEDGESGVYDYVRYGDLFPLYIESTMTAKTAAAEEARIRKAMDERWKVESKTKYALHQCAGGRYTYSGIRPIFPDGLIDEVIFTVSGEPTTEVARATVANPYTRPRKLRENEMTDAIERRKSRDAAAGRNGATL